LSRKIIQKLVNSKFKKDILFGYITQGVTVVFGFINIYIMTNFVGLEIYGQYAILVASVGSMSLLLTARSGEAVVKFYKREKVYENYKSANTFLLYGFILDLITAVLLFLLTYALSFYIAEYFLKDGLLYEEVILFSVVNVLFFLSGTIKGYFQANEKFYILNGIRILESIVLTIILLYVSTQIGRTLLHIVESYVLTSFMFSV